MTFSHDIYRIVLWGSVVIYFSILFYPAQTYAVVPVTCPQPCLTWDVALSGKPVGSTVIGSLFSSLPLGDVGKILAGAFDQESWFKDKEFEAATSIVSNPIPGFVKMATNFLSLDSIGWMLGRQILHVFTQEMVSWIRTGQFGGGPLFTTDLVGSLFNAADNAAGHFLAQYRSEEWYQLLCSPFRPQIYLALGRGRIPYIDRARCTVTDIVDNLENFYTDFSNGGWAAWFSTIEPQNNPYGHYLNTLEEKERREREVTFDIRHNFLAGQGFIGLKKCAPGAEFEEPGPDGVPTGKKVCTKYITVTPGKVVEDQLAQALGKDIEKLGVADEMNEIIAATFDSLLSWLVSGGSSGGGLLGSDLPDPDPIEPICSKDTNRPNGCGCTLASQCLSNSCSQGNVCITQPTLTIECNDNTDNDGDGLVDFPADPQCEDPKDDSESEGGGSTPQKLVIISTTLLPSGIVGTAYEFKFLAKGGVPFSPKATTSPYQWEAVDTGTRPLPAGLTLSRDGILSGTPSAANTWTFTAKVTDSVASSTQSAFLLTVQ